MVTSISSWIGEDVFVRGTGGRRGLDLTAKTDLGTVNDPPPDVPGTEDAMDELKTLSDVSSRIEEDRSSSFSSPKLTSSSSVAPAIPVAAAESRPIISKMISSSSL